MSDKLEMPVEQFAEAVAKENVRLNNRIEKLEAALREIAYGPHDVDASYAILFGTITTKAIKALEGKDE
jgi:hypothetical protein